MSTGSPAKIGDVSTWMTAVTSDSPVSTRGFGSTWTVMAGGLPGPPVPEPDPPPFLQEWVLWSTSLAAFTLESGGHPRHTEQGQGDDHGQRQRPPRPTFPHDP